MVKRDVFKSGFAEVAEIVRLQTFRMIVFVDDQLGKMIESFTT